MDLFLFYTNLQKTFELSNGLKYIIIDWEKKEKENRQQLFDTQINKHCLQDLIDLRRVSDKKIITRINGGFYIQEKEIKSAIDNGTDEIFLPMVQHPSEVEKAIKYINGQCKLGILVETNNAVNCINELIDFPLVRIYFGLNDFAIDNQNSNIFLPIINGILESVSMYRKDIPFGFGGLTHPSLGSPLSSSLLLSELVRLNCQFTFLRRSFYRDLKFFTAGQIFEEIEKECAKKKLRTPDQIKDDFQQLKKQILSIDYEAK